MRLVKKILFPLFSVFLIYRSTDLMRSLFLSNPQSYSFSEILIISFLLSLFVTGIFAFPGFAFPTNILLPTSYYKLKNPSRLEKVYQVLGVKYFSIFLMIYWGRKKNRRKYFDGTRKGLSNFVFQSKQSEFGHLTSFISLLVISLVLLFYGYYSLIIMITLINIVGNLYPVILQRYHRVRIEKLDLQKTK